MGINLYVAVPVDTPLAFLSYTDGLVVLAHIANGFLIVLTGLAIVAATTKLDNTLVQRLSVLAFILVAVAISTGLVFALQGQVAAFSMGMGVSFISAYTVYLAAYIAIARIPT